MDFIAHKREMLAHYIAMANLPGAKEHAWHRVKEMARDCPPLYSDMPALLTEAMREGQSPAADKARAEGG